MVFASSEPENFEESGIWATNASVLLPDVS